MRKRENKNFYEGSIELHPLAASLNSIVKTVQEGGLSEESTHELEADITRVAEHFGVSPKAAILIAQFAESNVERSIDEDDLAQYVGCSNIEFLGFRSFLMELEKRSIVMRCGMRGRRTQFCLSREAAKSIESGEPYEPISFTDLSADEFFTRLRMFFSDYRRDVIDCDRLLEDIWSVIDGNPHLPFCGKVADSSLRAQCCDSEQRFFFYLCHRYVNFGEETVPIERLMNFLDFMEDGQRVRRCISNEKSTLQKEGFVTFGGTSSFKDMDSLALSEEVRKGYFTGVSLFRKQDEGHRDLVPASSIKPKALFYNDAERSQMERLEELLEDGHFKGVQERLGEMGMRRGFAVLFAGGAGCGKTAGAYELARRTGRDIYAVDMSQLKSKWVGDSEKIVKGVFTTYAEMCRGKDKAPILLFNEADAIFSKRLENPQDSVDQMMNSIQNICLDAIENLEGILIATTNLPGNFCDDAFARRFIFKVNFTTPGPDVRAKIWSSMIPSLGEADAKVLAERYTFSSGNIENVARKAAVGYVLSGRKATVEDLMRYGDEETLGGDKGRRIGF